MLTLWWGEENQMERDHFNKARGGLYKTHTTGVET